VNVSDFDFILPPELVAQAPRAERGASRLLVLDRQTGLSSHASFGDLSQWLRRGDLLVLNDTRVFPARLLGRRMPSGGAVECLLLQRLADDRWDALVHPGQKLGPGARVQFGDPPQISGEILERRFHGRRLVRLWTEDGSDVLEVVGRIGHMPLPPYIKRADDGSDRERYQTVYARVSGSVAAPTAGLHFTDALLRELAAAGVERADLTLHVGYGTFKPVRAERVEDHAVDPESYTIGPEAAGAINAALESRRRIVSVGTTTTRALETAVRRGDGRVEVASGTSDLFVYPGHEFRAVGALVTNFHLPRSSLLMLVCAFGGRERVLEAYREAVARRYRFYSYGDAMLIL
jgi:S-adenosylmethionine:tRNA ribosyltransferase-isomerase